MEETNIISDQTPFMKKDHSSVELFHCISKWEYCLYSNHDTDCFETHFTVELKNEGESGTIYVKISPIQNTLFPALQIKNQINKYKSLLLVDENEAKIDHISFGAKDYRTLYNFFFQGLSCHRLYYLMAFRYDYYDGSFKCNYGFDCTDVTFYLNSLRRILDSLTVSYQEQTKSLGFILQNKTYQPQLKLNLISTIKQEIDNLMSSRVFLSIADTKKIWIFLKECLEKSIQIHQSSSVLGAIGITQSQLTIKLQETIDSLWESCIRSADIQKADPPTHCYGNKGDYLKELSDCKDLPHESGYWKTIETKKAYRASREDTYTSSYYDDYGYNSGPDF